MTNVSAAALKYLIAVLITSKLVCKWGDCRIFSVAWRRNSDKKVGAVVLLKSSRSDLRAKIPLSKM
jgi:hypothetical protein